MFFNRKKRIEEDNIGFIIKQKLESGDYNVIEGVFNTGSYTIDEISYEEESKPKINIKELRTPRKQIVSL